MLRIGVVLGLALAAVGCYNNGSETALKQDSVQNKPIVAVVPIIDRSNSDLTWNLSDELTHSVRERLFLRDNLYLISPEKINSVTKKFSESNDPFGLNTAWIKKAFPKNEFVVFMELVRHNEVALSASSPKDSAAQLTMTIRVRVFDIRGEQPKVVLQELVQNVEQIPRQFTKLNFEQVPYGSDMFDISPLGMAHAQLTKELASRIEDYILLASRR